MKARSGVAAILALAVAGTPLAAAEPCRFDHAVYGEPESGYTLRFMPLDPARATSAGTLHVFEIVRPRRDKPLSGEIIGNNGVTRPHGFASLDCPPEGADDDCIYWDGVVYALGDRSAALLPRGDEPAPEVLLLSDFGRQIRYEDPDFDIGSDPLPWDVFAFKSCAP